MKGVLKKYGHAVLDAGAVGYVTFMGFTFFGPSLAVVYATTEVWGWFEKRDRTLERETGGFLQLLHLCMAVLRGILLIMIIWKFIGSFA